MGVTGYLGYKITGNFYESISNSLGWPYDLINWKAYDTDAEIELMGMKRDKIGEPVLAGTVIGKVSSQAAAEFGLPEGVTVVMGTGDKQSELLGAGAINNGQAYVTLGTLSGLDIVCEAYKPSPTFSYAMFLSACPKLYHFEASVQKGFWLISWFRDNFAGGLKAEAEAKGVSIEELLNREAEAIPPGSDGLVVLPDWSPAGSRPNSKGLYLGFDDRHGRAHMFRALLEGLVTQLKIGSDHTAEQLGLPVKELYIGGGGSKSNLCAQIIADIFGVTVNRVKESENCSLGAAMCGAVGAGVYNNFQDAVKNMASATDQFQPNMVNNAFYDTLSKNVIQKIFPALENVFKDLSELKAPK
jgi:sugar (pentulose or hexulose) kinase